MFCLKKKKGKLKGPSGSIIRCWSNTCRMETHTYRVYVWYILYMKAHNYMDTSFFVLSISPSPPTTEIPQNDNTEDHVHICVPHASSIMPPNHPKQCQIKFITRRRSEVRRRERHIWCKTTGGHIHNNNLLILQPHFH